MLTTWRGFSNLALSRCFVREAENAGADKAAVSGASTLFPRQEAVRCLTSTVRKSLHNTEGRVVSHGPGRRILMG